MMRTIKNCEPTTIPGRYRVTLACGHVRIIARAKRPTNPVPCGECQLRVNDSAREVERLAIQMHRQSDDPIAWTAKAESYRDVLRKEAAVALETKVPKAG